MQAAESFGCNFSVCGACGLATVNTENGNCSSCNSTNFGWENDNASSQLVGGLFSQGSADVLLLMLNSGHNSALQLHNNGQISPPMDAPAPDFSSAPEEFSPPRKRQCVCQLEGDYYSRAPVPGKRATSASDPQSIYARQRREKINERLKVLQSLVPNGNKVDISTMLEQAIHYVKFLQLQIKLLRSDELWMHAPISYDIVREVLEESKGC